MFLLLELLRRVQQDTDRLPRPWLHQPAQPRQRPCQRTHALPQHLHPDLEDLDHRPEAILALHAVEAGSEEVEGPSTDLLHFAADEEVDLDIMGEEVVLHQAHPTAAVIAMIGMQTTMAVLQVDQAVLCHHLAHEDLFLVLHHHRHTAKAATALPLPTHVLSVSGQADNLFLMTTPEMALQQDPVGRAQIDRILPLPTCLSPLTVDRKQSHWLICRSSLGYRRKQRSCGRRLTRGRRGRGSLCESGTK
jgi:hypothetical protein